jgi:hopene-associated glycosyltransferase HpnB
MTCMLADFLAFLSLAIWIYLLFGRGGFWRIRGERREFAEPPPLRRVAVIVPARNEADVVAASVRSLVTQHYPAPFHVFLVDDASADGTAVVARQAAAEAGKSDRLTLLHAAPLPAGWTGKLWAVSEGITKAVSFAPDYFLFADADIVHPPGQIAHLLQRAEAENLDLASIMAKLSCDSLAEKILIPAFVYFFFMLYPPVWVASDNRATAAAAGGCILIRTAALERIGGISAIRNEIIDDCALARAVKREGRISLGLDRDTRSLRSYASWRQIEQMISRTAFAELNHSAPMLAAAVAAMTLTFLLPPVLLATHVFAATLGALAWLLMACSFSPMLRYYNRSILWSPLLPLIALFYVGATLHSAILYWRRCGGLWKDRIQNPPRPDSPSETP